MAGFRRTFPRSIILNDALPVTEQTFTITQGDYSPLVLDSAEWFPSTFSCVLRYMNYTNREMGWTEFVDEVTVPATVLDKDVRGAFIHVKLSACAHIFFSLPARVLRQFHVKRARVKMRTFFTSMLSMGRAATPLERTVWRELCSFQSLLFQLMRRLRRCGTRQHTKSIQSFQRRSFARTLDRSSRVRQYAPCSLIPLACMRERAGD